MAATLEAIKGGGGSVKVGAIGTISTLMTREIESSSSTASPQSPIPIVHSNGPLKPRKSMNEASSSSTTSIKHISLETLSKTKGHNLISTSTPKRQKQKTSLKDVGNDSAIQRISKRSPDLSGRTRSHKRSSHIPMLGSEDIQLQKLLLGVYTVDVIDVVMDTTVTLKFWHGGLFKKDKNGDLFYNVDADELCWWFLRDLASRCGSYRKDKIQTIYYLMPGMSLAEGLRRVYSDLEVRQMGKILLKYRCIDLYVLHGVDEPELLDEPQQLNPSVEPTTNVTEKTKPNKPEKLTPKRGPNMAETTPRTSPRNLGPLEVERSKVPTWYQWEDDRAEKWWDFIGDDTHVEDGFPLNTDTERDPDYEPYSEPYFDDSEGDSVEEGDAGEEFEVQVEEEGEQNETKVILEEEVDTSDDETRIARERVRDFNIHITQLAQQLQKDASEGRLGLQTTHIGQSNQVEQREEYASEYEEPDEEIHTPPDSGEEDYRGKKNQKKLWLMSIHAQGQWKRNKQLKSTWLARQLLEVFKARPHWPAKEIIEVVRLGYRVIVKKDFAYRAKYYAHRLLHGSMKDHYHKVGNYLEVLKASSPGTDMELVSENKDGNPHPIFHRLYMCFDGVKKGWKEGCRSVICVDACFLKTFLGGQLVSAVGRDGNYQMYPIAWEVVEGENNLSWEWFFKKIQSSLELGEGENLILISDEHQQRRADYNDALEELAKVNQAAAIAFKGYNPEVFCRAFMKTESKADVITNNMAETFNGYIINARTKHLLYMLEDIRAALMQRLVKKGKRWKRPQDLYAQGQPEDYVHDYYKKNVYMKPYSGTITPVEGSRGGSGRGSASVGRGRPSGGRDEGSVGGLVLGEEELVLWEEVLQGLSVGEGERVEKEVHLNFPKVLG
ncbi:UDP-N-acetylglucosamine--N-acetylmuramyl-(pentapeptide) pyrophosphoryl-undecaprenol N-acetylglucosamine transferase [Bienertia sinuspersici]